MEVNTNSLENINLKIKRHLGHGYLIEKMLTESLSFPKAQIVLCTSFICNNPMDKIKPTLERKVNLKMHLENYCDFAKLDQINNLDCFATKFGRCASDYNANYFGKVHMLWTITYLFVKFKSTEGIHF